MNKMQTADIALRLVFLIASCGATGVTVGTVAPRRNVTFSYTSDIRDYEGSAYHITCEYDNNNRDLVIQLNHDGSEALKMLRYQWTTDTQQGGTGASVDESYHFKSNSSKRVTLSGVPPQTRVSIGLVPNPEHEQGAKYWIYIGSTCWTGSKIGKPSKVNIRPTSAFTHPLVEWSAPRHPNGPIDGYDFSWCIMPTEEKVKRSTREAVANNTGTIPALGEQARSGETSGSQANGHSRRGQHNPQNGQSSAGNSQKADNGGNASAQSGAGNAQSGRAGQQGRGQKSSQSSQAGQGKAPKAAVQTEATSVPASSVTTPSTTDAVFTAPTTTTTTPKPEPKCATKDIPVNPANVNVFKGYKTVIENYDPTATYRVCIKAYNWKGTDKEHSDEECQMRRERAHFEREYFEMCPQ